MRSPAFSFYVRDWLCSNTVRELHRRKDRSVGAYLFLLLESWLQEPTATLPNDMDALADYARVTREELESMWPIVGLQFDTGNDGRIFNPRLMQAWKLQQLRKKNASKGGSETASKRRSKHNSKGLSKP